MRSLDNIVSTSPNRSYEKLLGEFKQILQRAQQTTIERAKAADQLVRGHPYHSLGVAAGLGLLVGILAGWRWKSWKALP